MKDIKEGCLYNDDTNEKNGVLKRFRKTKDSGNTKKIHDSGFGAIHVEGKKRLVLDREYLEGFLTPDRLRIVIRCAFMFFGGIYTSGIELTMGVRPFGIAWLASSAGFYPTVFSFFGIAIGSLRVIGGGYILLACVLMTLARLILASFAPWKRKEQGRYAKSKYFKESMRERGVISLIFTLIYGLGALLGRGNIYYDIGAIAVSLLAAPVLALTYTGVNDSGLKRSRYYISGIYAIIFTVVTSFSGLSVFGVSLPVLFSVFVSMYSAYIFGPVMGCTAGLICGIGGTAELVGVYPIMALVFGVLLRFSSTLASVLALISGCIWGLYSSGISAVGNIFPEIILAVAFIGPLVRFKILPSNPGGIQRYREAAEHNSFSERDSEVLRLEKIRGDEKKRRLGELSKCFESLSRVMDEVSRALSKPGPGELRQICEESFEEYCSRCGLRAACWDREEEITSLQIKKLAARLNEKGYVEEEDIGGEIARRCFSVSEIVNKINETAAHSRRTIENAERGSVLAADYRAVSKLLLEACESGDEEAVFDQAASKRLKRALSELDISASIISVSGGRNKSIFLGELDAGGMKLSSGELRAAAEAAVGCALTEPEFSLNGDVMSAQLHARPKYKVSVGRYSTSRGTEANGDVISSFRGDRERYYALISDGMGSGREASLTSSVCALFLERILGAGCSVRVALEMLNNYIRQRSIECFATIDLMEIDLYTGLARFIKSGAAPSFVLRDGRLFRLSSHTMPIGIIPDPDAEALSFNLVKGDLVIMISDGVTGQSDVCPWLYELLSKTDTKNRDAYTVAEEIAKRAGEEYGGDDVTVGVIEIKQE